ncbi:glycoside hydrolase [Ascodesmis nigricans]|uniref:Glycoside hydrolase n=1 Tax=Ascodesmis nigricans TaxID=341454 RepID=A0A4S2N298_9PEZI|nr:glycoside hydrolase [Ascodesmis nigricans]
MPNFLTIDGVHFKDEHNRVVTLRGINCAAEAKYPTKPDTPSHVYEHFFDGDNVSFVGRPFKLEDADIHFQRLRNYGYNTLRYIFTWEAIEAKGPGIYDEEWIDSTIALLRRAKDYNFMVIMDPHQDVWSRFAGGSGAPMWTLYAMGLNPQTFDVTEAALVHNTWPKPEEFPKMIWSTNYQRLACLVAWTLFFAGRDFAPNAVIDGRNIQDYLQGHFIDAMVHLAKRIHEAGDLEDNPIIGWESINEPNRGLIGYKTIDSIPAEQKLRKGTSPTAWQAILLGSGRALEVEMFEFGNMGPYSVGKKMVDPKGVQAWLPADYDDSRYGWKRDPEWKLGECIWAQNGVWDPMTDTLLKSDYFSKKPSGEPLSAAHFTDTYFMDHYRLYQKAIRAVHKSAIIFCQPPVLEIPPLIKGTDDVHDRMVYSPHYYDGITLMTKKWNRFYNVDVLGVLRGRYWTPAFAVRIGETAIRNCLRDQLKAITQEGLDNIGETPCLFSEIGIPYDMDGKAAYKSGDWNSQIHAMDANHFALEGANLHYTLWTYSHQNTHQWGDQWNGEDLSIYSLDDVSPASTAATTNGIGDDTDIDPANLKRALTKDTMSTNRSSLSDEPRSGRAAEAFIRPSPIYTAGIILESGFNLAKTTFRMKVKAAKPAEEEAPTEIFVPPLHFPEPIEVEANGRWEHDAGENVLRWWNTEGVQELTIKGVPSKVWRLSDEYAYTSYAATFADGYGQCAVM